MMTDTTKAEDPTHGETETAEIEQTVDDVEAQNQKKPPKFSNPVDLSDQAQISYLGIFVASVSIES